MHNFQQFIDYVYSFYGKDGLYDQNRTKEQISYALLMYLDDCNDPCIEMSWGDGDAWTVKGYVILWMKSMDQSP